MNSSLSLLQKLRTSIGKAILGKPEVIDDVCICLMAGGHLLIEDVPGVGKTTLALAVARSMDSSFQRIQFTSDLLPSDVLGVTIYNNHTREFEFKAGPIFTHVLLADEINRTTPKTQSALLEAMQDGAITIDRTTYLLPSPFMVIATQNPIEFHGTYPLPESQLDRFMMRISMGYPSLENERNILETKGKKETALSLTPVCNKNEILEIQKEVTQVHVDPQLTDYMLKIVEKTRSYHDLELGVSPRGALAFFKASQAKALLQGRTFVTPDDVKAMAPSVLSHRLIVSGRKTASSENKDARTHAKIILKDILSLIEVPA